MRVWCTGALASVAVKRAAAGRPPAAWRQQRGLDDRHLPLTDHEGQHARTTAEINGKKLRYLLVGGLLGMLIIIFCFFVNNDLVFKV